MLAALIALIVFGALRYTGFLSEYNFSTFLRYNAMFGLISLGMCFVIITGGIDLSVGSVVAMSSVVAALLSPYGAFTALLGAVLAGALVGLLNGWIIARLGIQPFITTLATLLGARGLALLLARNQGGVGVDTGNVVLHLVRAGRSAAAAGAGRHDDRRLRSRGGGPARHSVWPPRAGDRRRRGRQQADGPERGAASSWACTCCPARWRAWRA